MLTMKCFPNRISRDFPVSNFKKYLLLICVFVCARMCVCMCVCVCVRACMQRLEDNLQESFRLQIFEPSSLASALTSWVISLA